MWFSTGIGWLDAAEAWFAEYVIGTVLAVFVSAIWNYAVIWIPIAGAMILADWISVRRRGRSIFGMFEPRMIPLPPISMRERIAFYWRSAVRRLR
jgi:hypothetical protein